ncbi:MAG: adenine phosphoribosyltransferase [Nanoarchaeota archaeon]
MDLKKVIRTVPHWPIEGVMFRDITTLLQNPKAFRYACNMLAEKYKDEHIDAVAGIESRGFIFGAVVAEKLGKPFVPMRKPGKLPWKTVAEEFEKEYGKDKIEVHEDAFNEGDNVLIVDDLIATGGTAFAAAKLVEKLGAKVAGMAFVIGLPDLKGIELLKDYSVYTLVDFEGE